MRKGAIATPLLLLGVLSAQAQQVPPHCYMDEIHGYRMQNDLQYRQAFEATQENFTRALEQIKAARAQAERSSPLYIIPTVVHVFHDGGSGNLNIAQIHDGIRVLNEDYQKENADTGNVQTLHKGIHADTQIEFRLARKDPNGNCTNGIVYHRTPYASDNFPPNCLKAISSWDNDRYMNIYLVPSLGGLLGYSAFPVNGMIALEDGNFMPSTSFGSIGTAANNAPYNLGRTATHEVGHYLNLFHTFQGGCFGVGDQCADTPPTSGANFGCQQGQNSCSNDNPDLPDMPENFMDYSQDNCLLMFTYDQTTRMHAALNSPSSQRGQLVTPANYIATGVEDPVTPCAPMPDYMVNKDVTCVGSPIRYVDNHYNGTATIRSWEFPGGIPAASTDSIVDVTYAQPGNYSFKLSVGNANGTNLIQYDGVIVVTEDQGMDASQWGSGFEDASTIGSAIQIQGWELGDNFERVTNASQEGAASMKVNGYHKDNAYFGYAGASSDYQEEYLYLPAVDLTTQDPSDLHFWYAYTKKFFGQNNAKLEVQVNLNCSHVWSTRLTLDGNDLRTASQTNSPFTPNGASQWVKAMVSLASYASHDHVRIRLKFTAERNSNNLYVDNFFLMEIVGLEGLGTLMLNAYPNPATDHIILENGTLDLNEAVFCLRDLSGRVVLELPVAHLAARTEMRVQVPPNISKGIYVLSLVSDAGSYIRRWVIR